MDHAESGYIEFHMSSGFSFLQGASLPEHLAQKGAQLGYTALALMDLDGLYGAPRFNKSCLEMGIRPLVGAKLSLTSATPGEIPILPLLVETHEGYQNLCRLITRVKLTSTKGKGGARLSQIEEAAPGLVCLTGDAEGPVRLLLKREGPNAAYRYLEKLKSIFGFNRVYVELQRHLDREEEALNQILVETAQRLHLPLLATNGVSYASSDRRMLLDVLTCIRHKTDLDSAGKLLSCNSERFLKRPEEMRRLFKDIPQAIFNCEELGQQLEFTLENLSYQFPTYPVPSGENMMSYLRKLTEEGARQRYRPYTVQARRQIAKELNLIEKLNLAGYFLIVWDIVRFCRQESILAQGRGSAANSAVCYSLGITAVDPVGMDLLFERFLSEERGKWPDIDLDLPSGERRERVIQYVYQRYGVRGAAMTANVITYQKRSAAREIGKSFGFSPRILNRISRSFLSTELKNEEISLKQLGRAGVDLSGNRAKQFVRLWKQIQDMPRHLGQHPGGMVMALGGLDSIVPLEKASMPGRTVIQWDKDDCSNLGIIKVDLLGLGIMSVLQDSLEMTKKLGENLDLAHLPADDTKVYSMLRHADTIGVFQVESRAQMAILPRLKPTHFYDLVVEVAIIRPGPIVGQMVHPYLKRRAGLEAVTYPHPSLEPILRKTLGVPIFQEQLLKISMVAAGFSGGEAEELRRALKCKHSHRRMAKIEKRLRQGMNRKGIKGKNAEAIVRYITSFALYGFPESHAASFALLTYASAYLKAHQPAPFYTALLNNQPMGFYHPSTLIQDAQRHGLQVHPIDVLRSNWLCTIEDSQSIRLGLMYCSGLAQKTGQILEKEGTREMFKSLQDMRSRTPLTKAEVTTLAKIGALAGFGLHRRAALWQAEKLFRPVGPLLESLIEPDEPCPLPAMNVEERLVSDYMGTGLTLGPHPLALKRSNLDNWGTRLASRLPSVPDGETVRVAGKVIARQLPSTAHGVFFISLEDETGIANIVVKPHIFKRERSLIVTQTFLLVEGILQNQEGVTSVSAKYFWPLKILSLPGKSHDFC